MIDRPAGKPRVFEHICESVRQQLSSGSLVPGDKLPPEREMAVRFGVGRTAVREALRALETSGLIALQKGSQGGAVILPANPNLARSFSDMLHHGSTSFDHFAEARVLIQDVIVRLAVARATEADFIALEADTAALERDDHPEGFAYRVAFYSILAKATRNSVLRTLVDAFTEVIQDVNVRFNPGRRTAYLVETRTRFVQHLRNRDEDAAVAEMTAHLARLHDHIRASMAEDQASGGAPG